MIIVIPMAGASSRFTSMGMAPKYTLKTQPFRTLFDDAVSSFDKWFDTATFLIIVKDEYAKEFAEVHATNLGIKDLIVVNLDFLTKGQAETVKLGLQEAGLENRTDELIIFNIDSVRHNLVLPEDEVWDTLFDAFYDEDAEPIWSFCKVDKNMNIIKTAEKRKISPWCSTGLYIFRGANLYLTAYNDAIKDKSYNYYIAPLYNKLKGMTNRLLVCPHQDIDFAGTPSQYNEYVNKVNR